ncbi:MutL C terminal dimerization domain family protein [Clavispora lusitaniae]|uniref:MutL C terminal dimerization domain family protein n=1 Tax=Clavispora lusitaniae TaxID=36911 RepID=UPI00202CA49A|nr:MutL C terminal dimerization domain family protein [Clavispora lusitaniae]
MHIDPIGDSESSLPSLLSGTIKIKHGMPIRKLRGKTRQTLRSQVVIDSVETVVRQLVHNSLDAQASFLRVKIDLASLSVCVEDNGHGIEASDLPLVGKRYHTSSGGRGESLSSIAVCSGSVIVRSKTQAQQENCVCLGRSCPPELLRVLSSFFQLDSLEAAGTQVMVSRVFGSMPVRLENARRKADKLRQKMKSVFFELLCAPHVKAEVYLLEQGEFVRMFSVEACDSVSEKFSSLFRLSAKNMVSLSAKSTPCSVEGSFCLQSSHRSELQFVFLNGEHVPLQSQVNRIFASHGYGLGRQSVFGRSLRLHPVYCFHVQAQDTADALRFLKEELAKVLAKVLAQGGQKRYNEGQRGSPKRIRKSTREEIDSTQEETQPSVDFSQPSVDFPLVHVSQQDIGTLKVVNQVSKQFILAKSGSSLFILDQHACDERVQVEQFFREYITAMSDPSCDLRIRCDETMAFSLAKEEQTSFVRYEDVFRNFGISYVLGNRKCTVTHLPRALSHETQPQRLKLLLLQHISEMEEGEKQVTMTGNWVQDVSNIPSAISESLISSACRQSVKFGDLLSKAEMEYLISQLEKCILPFQCAHGRPTIVPLEADMMTFTEDEDLD